MIWRVILRVLMIVAGLFLFVGTIVSGLYIVLVAIVIVAAIYDLIWGEPSNDPW